MSFNDSIRSKRTAEKFFELFNEVFPDLLFHSMGQSEPLQNKFEPTQAASNWERVWDYIYHGKKPAPFYVLPHWLQARSHNRWTESVGVILDEEFWSKNKIPDPSERAIRLLKVLATLGSPLYGNAYLWSEFEEKAFVKRALPNGLVSSESVSLTPREGLHDLFWANFFGKPYIDIFGLETLRKVAVKTKEKLPNGYLLVYGSNPFDWRLPSVRELQEKDKTGLNQGAFLDRATGYTPDLNILSPKY